MRLLPVLLLLPTIGCAASEGMKDSGTNGASDSGLLDGGADASVDAGFTPYMPPAPVSPVRDEQYLQEFNHTSNEVEPGIGALVGVLVPPKTFTGFDVPTQVTPRGIVRHKPGGGFDILAIDSGHQNLIAAAVAGFSIMLAGPAHAYMVDAKAAFRTIQAPGGTSIIGVAGGAANAYLLTSGGIAVDGAGGTFWQSAADVYTAAVESGGVLYAGGDNTVAAFGAPSGAGMGAASWKFGASDGLAVGQVRAVVSGVTIPTNIDLVIVGDNGVAGLKMGSGGGKPSLLSVPEFAKGRVPLGAPRAAVKASDGGFIVATSGGAYRIIDRGHGPEWRVYNAERWLPSEDMRGVAADPDVPDGPVWFATAGGLASVTAKRITLEEKLVSFVERIVKRHDRDGAVADSRLMKKGDLSTSIPWDSDNDGSWTSYWLMSECFGYMVTGAPDARANFDRSLEAMLRLRNVTGTDWFLARSVIRKEGCKLDDCDNPDDGFWYTSPDGKWWVKRDTSNDEVIAHLFMMGHAYDLCADEGQRAGIREHIAGIIGGIMDHGWRLLDPVTGKVTTYGQYEPEYVNDSIPGMFGDGGDRAAMILSGLTLAHYLTGEQRFMDGKNTLIRKHHYDDAAEGIMDHPARPGKMDNDEMATYCFFILLRYESDPALRAKWMNGWLKLFKGALERQQGAWWNLVHAVVGGDNPDLAMAARWLRLAPADMIRWDMRNSQRLDLIPSPAPYTGQGSLRSDGFTIPYDERRTDRWNTHQFMVDGGMGGMVEMDAADVLAPYWMARYYGFIVK